MEIGPFDAPVVAGANVSYFDVLDQEGLVRRAKEIGRDFLSVPFVEFVSPVGDLGIVDRQFAGVFSAHLIEHQPDLVRHLQEIARILRPGGTYHVIVPDRRYCFDHYMADSLYAEIIAAHEERRKVHTPANVALHRLGTVHNDPVRHWVGNHGSRPAALDGLSDAQLELDECRKAASGEYVDVHAWFFTPASFAEIIGRLHDHGLVSLKIKEIYATRFGTQEFFATLVADR